MLERVRQKLTRWVGRSPDEALGSALLFASHEEVQDIARQMARTKVEIDRSVLSMRSWARDLARRLEDSRGKLTHTADLRSLDETVGGFAHNLNNSLAAILGHAELMLGETQTEVAKRRLSVIRDVALEASATVRRLQDLISRQPHAVGSVGLPTVIAQAVEMTAPRWRDDAQRRGVAIVVTQDLEALPPVDANAFELREALMRLILNAVTDMPEGGTLAIRAASEESGWVLIEVRDTGMGMPVELPRRITERASSLTFSESRGLTHVADVVERHGGTMEIQSEPGRGTAVCLRLRASRFQIIPATGGLAERAAEEARMARVLLVDDDPRQVAVLSDMLGAGGHPVSTATGGEEAIKMFDPATHDVVITDLGMPGMSGWEVAKRVKNKSPETAVFLLTGWGETVLARESSQVVDRVIAKPVSAESLLEQLAELRRSRPAST